MIKKNLLIILILVIASFLRLWKLDKVPVSLFGDELDVGYHAYSIFKTGKDYSGNSWPIHFHSIAEWRTPLYLYSAVPSVALFGISPLGVRLPAAIFGILGVWGMYLLVKEILKIGKFTSTSPWKLEILAALLLAISPWHLQYSRAAFEVTMLLAFLFFGLYLFFSALRQNGKWLWLSVTFLTFTPWIYNTSKLFVPLLFVFLLLMWGKKILNFPKRELIRSVVAGLIIGIPIAYGTIFGGGAQRAGYVSVFTDPSIQPEVGTARVNDALMRGEAVLNHQPTIADRFFHNKITFWSSKITGNILQTYSADFLFVNGDPNLRHSIKGFGQFYRIEIVSLILGLILFFASYIPVKIKIFVAFWLIAGVLPSAITRDGGNHATRLILILPPLIFLIAYGLSETYVLLRKNLKYLLVFTYCSLFIVNLIFYLHDYYVHNPWDSERWWHAGYKEAIQSIKAIDKDYDKVIITMAGEPLWIFFAGWYQYPPDLWQKEFPIGNDEYINGFGKVSHTNKFYFGNFNVIGKSIYDLGKYIDSRTLYLAAAKEIGANLITEPERTPPDLKLVNAISYPSGEPVFYLFTLR